MEKFLKIEIAVDSHDEADVYVAGLSDIGFYAFEQTEAFLIAYITQVNFNEQAFKKILAHNVEYNIEVIEDKNWNEEWERGFQPVYVGHFAGIRASFHKPLQNIKHEIIVTPKMSFGTGHHATTYLMIEQMQEIDFKKKTVLDLGTGTGVLAILAEKLGASEVTALDNDEWSINNAMENVEVNKSCKVKVQYKNSLDDLNEQDIVLANINFNFLTQNAGAISSITKTGSLLLLSGFFIQDEVALTNAYTNFGFTKKNEKQLDGWSSLLFSKEQVFNKK